MATYRRKLINDYIIFEVQNLAGRQPDITIFGDLLYTCKILSLPLIEGENSIISDISCGIGGVGHISIALSKLGAKVNLMSFAGNDRNCTIMMGEMAKKGIKTENIKILGGEKTPVFMIFLTKGSQERFQAATLPGVLEKASLNYFDYEKIIYDSDLIYTSNSLNMDKLNREILYLTKYAKTKNITTAHEISFKYSIKKYCNRALEDREDTKSIDNKITIDLFEHLNILFLNSKDLFLITDEKDTVKSMDQFSPNITTVVVKISPSKIIIRHLNNIYHFNTRIGNIFATIDDEINYKYFQSAFLYFYFHRLPIEITSVLGLAWSYIYQNSTFYNPNATSIENLLRFVKKFKIFDEGKGSIMIE